MGTRKRKTRDGASKVREARFLCERQKLESLEDRRMYAIDSGAAADAAATSLVQQEYGQLPLSFKADRARPTARSTFSPAGMATRCLTDTGAVFDLPIRRMVCGSSGTADAIVAAGTVIQRNSRAPTRILS